MAAHRRALSDDSSIYRVVEATLRSKLEKGDINQIEYDSMVQTHVRMLQAAAEGSMDNGSGGETAEALELYRPVSLARTRSADATQSTASGHSRQGHGREQQGWRDFFSPIRSAPRHTTRSCDDDATENSAGETDGETRSSEEERRHRRPATDEEAEAWTAEAIRRWDGEGDSAGADRADLVQLARRGGLPSSGSTRQAAWARLAGVHKVSTGGLGFEALRAEVAVSEKVLHKIRKDTRRSCCTETFKVGLDGSENGPLFAVLRSYAALDPHIGYVQGMNYVAALCVIDAPSTESGFHLFCRLMQGTNLRRLYDSKDELIHHLILHIDQQVARNAPELHAHMEEQGFLVQCYAVEWLTTLLIYNVPYETAAAILGLYLVEGGLSFIVQLGVALLVRQAPQLCTLSLEHFLPQYTAYLKGLRVTDMLNALETLEANAVLRLKRPRWVPDEEIEVCHSPTCSKKFGGTTRKHHCRLCGFIYCSACSRAKVPLPLLGYLPPVRVCNQCVSRGGLLESSLACDGPVILPEVPTATGDDSPTAPPAPLEEALQSPSPSPSISSGSSSSTSKRASAVPSFLSFSWSSQRTVAEEMMPKNAEEVQSSPPLVMLLGDGERVRNVPPAHPITVRGSKRWGMLNTEERRAVAERDLNSWLKYHLPGTHLSEIQKYSKSLSDLGFEAGTDLGHAALRDLQLAGIKDAEAAVVLRTGIQSSVRLGKL